jgi:hypothetical protein
MHRWLSVLPMLFLGQCLSGSTPGAPSPVQAQRLTISSEPVPLNTSNPLQRTVGRLTYVGGWRLTSDARAFGGLSALDIDGNRITAISDIGAIIRFRFGRFGNASDASLKPVPRGCGPVVAKVDNDTESLAHDDARQTWWIGMEYRNKICRTNADFSAARFFAPRDMADWPKKRGPESLLRLKDGRFLTIAEENLGDDATHRALIFDRDPTDPAARVTKLNYRSPEGFSPTDAAQLPDGRILILNRNFGLPSLFTGQLVLLDPSPMTAGSTLQGQVIARFESPVIADNFEGLSVTTENSQTIIWIVSDDNYARWQRTLLLKFRLN